jgi:hypothetical protein
MAEKIFDRAERREEIRLKLEYLRVFASLAVIITLVFGGLQWRIANQTADFANKIANENAYQRITNEWRDHLKTFVEKPNLRPYFEGKKQISADDPNKEMVLALADVRLDVMDAILTYAALRGASGEIVGWNNTIANAFRTSPVLCTRLSEVESSYGLIVPIYRANCR